MNDILSENDSFLNFSYLTSAFYNFVLISNDNYKKIKLPENDEKFDQEFEELNFDNYTNYLEYLSYQDKSGDEINKIKIKYIKSVFNLEFNENEKEKILLNLSEKMKVSIFTNKNHLIKLLSQQIINFIFDVYQLIYLIIKYMDKNEKEKILQINIENLIEIGKIKSEKDSLSTQNNLLKEKLQSFKKKINNNNQKNEDILLKKNKELEKEISKLKETMKCFENKIEKIQNSLDDKGEEIKKTNDLLLKEIEDKKNLESQLENTNELLLKEIEDKRKLESQLENTNDLLAKEIEGKIKLKEQVQKLEKQVEKLDKSNDYLFNEMQMMKKKDLCDENYQFMKNLNIDLLKEGIAFNDKHLALYKGENNLDSLKSELVKRDLKIKCLEGLKKIYEKDLKVKESQIDKLKLEIEDLKKGNK